MQPIRSSPLPSFASGSLDHMFMGSHFLVQLRDSAKTHVKTNGGVKLPESTRDRQVSAASCDFHTETAGMPCTPANFLALRERGLFLGGGARKKRALLTVY